MAFSQAQIIPMSVPEVIVGAEAMRAWTRRQHASGRRVALVPTMGALHEGHLALVKKAAEIADRVAVSIFVNPTQFGPGEDFDAYPRTLDEDRAHLEGQGCCDVVFAPAVSEMYPLGANLTWVSVDGMGDHLCGSSRPGHFRGVTTVVSRLFAIIQPDVAVFGLKDAQQFFILRRMTREMGFGTELVGLPTVREEDGLALSSRNRYLTPAERAAAPVLRRALLEAEASIVTGGQRRAASVVSLVRSRLAAVSECREDYVQLVDTDTLQPVSDLLPGSRVLIALAAFFGKARLIDNVLVDVPQG